jgi:hypothetical protein
MLRLVRISTLAALLAVVGFQPSIPAAATNQVHTRNVPTPVFTVVSHPRAPSRPAPRLLQSGRVTSGLAGAKRTLLNTDVGPNSPSSATGWTNSTNVQSSDDAYATATLTSYGPNTTPWLTTNNFGFALPTNAVVVGITTHVERHAGAANSIKNNGVILAKAGTQVGSARCASTIWPATDSTETCGGTSDLWGTTWTAADINNSGFGVQLRGYYYTSWTTLYVDQISVTVTYTTDPNAPLTAPANVSLPEVSGAAHVGSTLMANQGTWSGNPADTFDSGQWFDCVSQGNTCSAIDGATDSTYVAAASDYGYALRFQVTATNSQGSASAMSVPTSWIATDVGPNSPSSAAGWTNSTNVQSSDDAYATTTLTWYGPNTTPWLAANNFGFALPSNAVVVGITVHFERHAGAANSVKSNGVILAKAGTQVGSSRCANTIWTTTDYVEDCGGTTDLWGTTWTAADINNSGFGVQLRAFYYTSWTTFYVDQITVTVTYTANPDAAAAAPVNVSLPEVTGAAHVGATLTANQGTWSGNPADTFNGQWLDCVADGSACAPIDGATASTYVVTSSDYGYGLRYQVTASNGGTPVPALSTQTNLIAADVGPNPPSAASGWTSSTNVQSSDDVYASYALPHFGANTTPFLIASNFGFNLPSNAIVVGITARVERHSTGGTLTNYADYLTKAGTQVGTYRCASTVWPTADGVEACGGLTDLWGASWTAADINNPGFGVELMAYYSGAATTAYVDQITVTVTYTVPSVGILLPHASNLAIQGNPATGDALSLPLSQLAWTNTPITSGPTEQWQRCDAAGANCADILGETGEVHMLVAADNDHTIVVEVTAANAYGTSVESSAPSAVIDFTPVNTALPTITGQFSVGGTLVASTGAWLHSPTSFTVAWSSCDVTCTSLDSSGLTYEPTSADEGRSLKIVVTANAFGDPTAESLQTPVIINQADLDAMALAYRPALLFDSDEPYRPITIQALVDEGGQQVCLNPSTCAPITSADAIVSAAQTLAANHDATEGQTYIQMSGYQSPWAPCGLNGLLLDCGDASAIYYDYGQSANGYHYIDYWIFYRLNLVFGDTHVGDWEGVTVILNPSIDAGSPLSQSIAGVIFAEHSKMAFRLPAVLRFCADSADIGSNCLTDDLIGPESTNTHVADFVALESHASYPDACFADNEGCTNPETGQNWSPLGEGRHDGSSSWENNSDFFCNGQCVKPLASLTQEPVEIWNAYEGIWGDTNITGPYGSIKSPSSPSLQARYSCAQDGWTCATDDLIGDPMPQFSQLNKGQAATAAQSAKRPSSVVDECATWYDPQLAAFACSPSELRQTVANEKLNTSGTFSLSISGLHAGTAPGLVQVLGGPLTRPTTIRLRGRTHPDEVIKLTYSSEHRIWTVTLTNIRATVGATVTIAGPKHKAGPPNVRLHKMTAHLAFKPIVQE